MSVRENHTVLGMSSMSPDEIRSFFRRSRSQPPPDDTAAAGDVDDVETAVDTEPNERAETSTQCTSWVVVCYTVLPVVLPWVMTLGIAQPAELCAVKQSPSSKIRESKLWNIKEQFGRGFNLAATSALGHVTVGSHAHQQTHR